MLIILIRTHVLQDSARERLLLSAKMDTEVATAKWLEANSRAIRARQDLQDDPENVEAVTTLQEAELDMHLAEVDIVHIYTSSIGETCKCNS